MKLLLNIPLKAGIPLQIGRGRFVRLLEAAFPVAIETQTLEQKDNKNGDLLANVGAEFPLFESAMVTSEADQTITLAYSELAIYDNRLGVNGNLVIESISRGASEIAINEYPLTAGTRVQIMAPDARRRTALVTTETTASVYVDGVATAGFTVDGVLEHECTAELWVESASDQNVTVMEYLN